MTSSTRPILGLGTYRGPCSDAADVLLDVTVRTALSLGIRCFDTAINYRCQRAERVLGVVLNNAFKLGLVHRNDCHVSSKVGFVPWELSPPVDEAAYDRQTVVEAGLATLERLSPDGHCLAPAFVRWSVERSLQNLGLEYLDCMYIHNPEAQLSVSSQEELYGQLSAAFAVLESFVEDGRLRAYGVSTWGALRVPPEHPEHLSLQRIVDAASCWGADHHLRFVQAPLNLELPEAATSRFQSGERNGPAVSVLSEVRRLNLKFVASAPLNGGALRSHALAALNFVRSLPDIEYVLVGAMNPADVTLPASLLNEPRLSGRQLLDLLKELGSDDGL